MQRPWSVALCTAVVGLALAGCSKPEPPEKDRPPQPTAASEPAPPPPGAAAADYAQRSLSAEQIRAPIDRAKAVEGTVLEAAKQQQAQIDAQTSGQSPPPAQ